MNNVITVKNLTKSFKLYHSNKDRLLNIIPFINKRFDMHISLDNISFEIKRGEFVSIIGKNGSGKSTLLKILCGVLQKTSGEYIVNGYIVSLLELGTGFNPELSGRDNIIASSKTMNFDINYINSKMNEIEAFADLEEYFDMPIKTYSSGMYVRLAMSLFLHLNPDIFIIDEALSVGDIFFQQKCFAKIEQMKKNGVAFLFVSHDINTVLNMSDRVLLLDHSKQIYFGDKHEASRLYLQHNKLSINSETNNLKKDNLLENLNPDVYEDKASIYSLRVFNQDGIETLDIDLGKSLVFQIDYKIHEQLIDPTISLVLKNRHNILITAITYTLDYNKFLANITVPFNLEGGEYSFDLNIIDRKSNSEIMPIIEYKNINIVKVFFDYQNSIPPFIGMVGLNTKIKFE
ncbi:ABC transporter ATP-binding protein [Arcobacter sp. F2176]|uniref:ABC transporter ATP-binding protein n=1 Tax=Arcobacter sp. F2176 TaxID=2044511 RepID=UPI00100BD641|nr:ABC transporter ATP-binding protein [Arcobacter sp. F2176]RXJ79183.1 hypothetical protein CRU95_14875 [Arcobacter sp. F2176]